MPAKTILLNNINLAVDKDGLFQPTDDLLDKIWMDAVSSTDDIGRLMSDVINGNEDIDWGLIWLAHVGGLNHAMALREVAQKLFRSHAYFLSKKHEIDVMDAYREGPASE